jgi:hypothetical protein
MEALALQGIEVSADKPKCYCTATPMTSLSKSFYISGISLSKSFHISRINSQVVKLPL